MSRVAYGVLFRLNAALTREFHSSAKCDYLRKCVNCTDEVITRLKNIVGNNNVSTALSVRKIYGTDEGPHKPCPADAVVFSHSTEEVSEVAKLCNQQNIPMIPHGTGTGMEHGISAPTGGVCVDLSQMTSILHINHDDFDAVVEPGVTWRSLNAHLRNTGLMFPVDPGADACLGGMAATRASGTNAVRYGTMKENVLNLEVVLADGTVLHTAGPGRHTKKSAAGYDLTNLFIGSEGTLGFITKLTVRLHAIPETTVVAICCFPSEKNAIDSVIETLHSSIPVARIEFMDDVAVRITNKYNNLNYPVSPSLFLEFHGSESETAAQTKQVGEIVSSHGGSNFIWAENTDKRNKLWKARHKVYHSVLAHKPGLKSVVTDTCVPISKLSEIIVETKQNIALSGLFGTVLGHVGDGNFHVQLLYDPEDESQIVVAQEFKEKVSERALTLGGTCTGEHGIGVGKLSLLEREFGEAGIKVMQLIKEALDPKWLMNPGKKLLKKRLDHL